MKLRARAPKSTAYDPDAASSRIRADRFLTRLYADSLRDMLDELELATGQGYVVEVGSAGGITKDLYPWIETTDVRAASGIDRVVDGATLPYDDDGLDGIIAKDALHHIPDPEAHFAEVVRTLKPGARAAYLEPNWNALSRAIFRWLHPEPFDDKAVCWSRASAGPMDSNQALAYMLFERDVELFHRKFPALRLTLSKPRNGLAFLLSGGVHSRLPVPAKPLEGLKKVEDRHCSILRHTGLNRLLVLEKRTDWGS